MRKNLGVEDNFVIGHVGNFCYPKNYPFILDVVEAASKPVSYTHLDVYKRQPYKSSKRGCIAHCCE